MDSVDLEVLKHSAEWIEGGRRVLLVTVVKTWGSSPRPEGAMLAVRDDGHVVGSVSGGCIEDDLIDKARSGVNIATGEDVLDGQLRALRLRVPGRRSAVEVRFDTRLATLELGTQVIPQQVVVAPRGLGAGDLADEQVRAGKRPQTLRRVR